MVRLVRVRVAGKAEVEVRAWGFCQDSRIRVGFTSDLTFRAVLLERLLFYWVVGSRNIDFSITCGRNDEQICLHQDLEGAALSALPDERT